MPNRGFYVVHSSFCISRSDCTNVCIGAIILYCVISQASERLRLTIAWSVLTRRNPVIEDGGEAMQFAKSLQNQLPHVMGGFMGGLIRPSPLPSLASGGVDAAKSIQKCLTTLDELGEHARALAGRGDISGMNVLCQNILLDICYYRLVVHTLEFQTSPEDNAYFSNGLQKRRGRPSKISKSRERLVSTVGTFFLFRDHFLGAPLTVDA
ncbi:hypothetical protein BS47DRAFT_109445 [Hydnum rufescens UP504]|uniref:Uncharacterized protein n=1 Tax=Hydnum rufescens UP504 TaxID=1448309 RepID=A0A9P6AR70_9AGAM|nr:hypothetical protein BS47DRAFT_109445 [Hydnum rufescens UP504]